MNFEKDSIIYKKTFKLALDIINTCKKLMYEKKEFVMSKQLLRSGTSIGANVSESFHSQSTKDNIAKLYIAIKEAGETKYWLELLLASNYLDNSAYSMLSEELSDILKILSTIIKNNKLKLYHS